MGLSYREEAERGRAEPAEWSTMSERATVSGASPTWRAFDQLDTLVRVTTVHGWVYLAVLFAVGVGSIAFAFLYQVPTKVNGEGLLLTERDAPGAGPGERRRGASSPGGHGSGIGSMSVT